MSVAAEKIGRKAVKTVNSVVNFTVLVVVLLLAAFAVYAIWDSEQVYQAAEAAQYAIYKPTVEDGGQSFGELQAINPEVFSWITVYGTHIDYPVTQAADNMKYVNTNARGGYSLSGSIFLDCGNDKNYRDFNSILFGHHMEKQAMFGEIGLFSDKSYFERRLYGNLYFNGKDHGIEFFAFMHTDAYDGAVFSPNVRGREARQAYLDNLMAKALYTRELGVTIEDKMILLSTCSSASTNGRDILIGRITDRIYNDPFKTEEINNTRERFAADARGSVWESITIRLLVGLLVLIVLLILLVNVIHHKRKPIQGKKSAENENGQKE